MAALGDIPLDQVFTFNTSVYRNNFRKRPGPGSYQTILQQSEIARQSLINLSLQLL